jgi:hypothetical protein
VLDRPPLELHVLGILKANLAVNHVSRRVISGLRVAEAALRAHVVPKGNLGLSGDHRHASFLRARLQRGVETAASTIKVPRL